MFVAAERDVRGTRYPLPVGLANDKRSREFTPRPNPCSRWRLNCAIYGSVPVHRRISPSTTSSLFGGMALDVAPLIAAGPAKAHLATVRTAMPRRPDAQAGDVAWFADQSGRKHRGPVHVEIDSVSRGLLVDGTDAWPVVDQIVTHSRGKHVAKTRPVPGFGRCDGKTPAGEVLIASQSMRRIDLLDERRT